MKIYHNPRTLFSLAVCVVAFSDWMLTAFLSQGLGMVVLYPWSYGPSSFPGFLYGRVIWTHDSVFEYSLILQSQFFPLFFVHVQWYCIPDPMIPVLSLALSGGIILFHDSVLSLALCMVVLYPLTPQSQFFPWLFLWSDDSKVFPWLCMWWFSLIPFFTYSLTWLSSGFP